MSNYDIKEGSYDETFNLDVSKEDLRIYEELAWYQSTNQTVSSAKYPKYVDRIKKVQNQEFAALLTQKLSSIGLAQDLHKQNDAKDVESQKKDMGELPLEIRDRVCRGLIISNSLLKNLSSSERQIIIEYNRWAKDLNRGLDDSQRKEVLKRLSVCRTYRSLEAAIKTFKNKFHSADI